MSIQDPPQSVQPVVPDDPSDGPSRAAVARSTVVILQHSNSTPLGLLADVLDAAGLESHLARPGSWWCLPDPTEVALVIAIGSDAPADRSPSSSVSTEVQWLRQTDAAGASILGIGSGAKTLAIAFGGGIDKPRRPQHGWTWLETSEPELVAPGPWLAWHDHEIVLPAAAEPIAYTASGPQAFTLQRHLGIHFHPEITPEILGGWVLGSNHRALDTQGVLEAAVRDLNTTATNAYQLLATYIESVGLPTHTRQPDQPKHADPTTPRVPSSRRPLTGSSWVPRPHNATARAAP